MHEHFLDDTLSNNQFYRFNAIDGRDANSTFALELKPQPTINNYRQIVAAKNYRLGCVLLIKQISLISNEVNLIIITIRSPNYFKIRCISRV